MQRTTNRRWLLGLGLLGPTMVLITAFALRAPGPSEVEVLASLQQSALEVPALDPQAKALGRHGLDVLLEEPLATHASLEAALGSMGIAGPSAAVLEAQHPELARRFQEGRRSNATLLAHVDRNNHLLRLQIQSPQESWNLSRVGTNQYASERSLLKTDLVREHRSVRVRNNFFEAMDEARVPALITDAVVDLFESEIDFRRAVTAGDRVRVIYEIPRRAGRDIGTPRLLAVRFEAGGEVHEAIYYEAKPGRPGSFYNAEGKSVKRGYLAAPLRFTRVTSSFTNTRIHPLFGTARAHRGIDYSAPEGTPVLAVADGVIQSAGFDRGYGNAIEISHTRSITTFYAHLSRFAPGMRPGKAVAMGEVIGYVGSTGWATGPHLHYEFREYGRAVNPNRMVNENPRTPNLAGEQREAYLAHAREIQRALRLLDGITTASAAPKP